MSEPDIYSGLRQFRRTLDQTAAVLRYLLDNGEFHQEPMPTAEEIAGFVNLWEEINFIVGNHLASDEPMKGQMQTDKKAEIYNAVAAINSAFGAILSALQTLQGQGIITADYLQEKTEQTEELRAGINSHILSHRQESESEDWYKFGELRKTTEKRLLGEEANGDLPQVQPKQE